MKRWRCRICGYIHLGDQPPDRCRYCGATHHEFRILRTDHPAVPAVELDVRKIERPCCPPARGAIDT